MAISHDQDIHTCDVMQYKFTKELGDEGEFYFIMTTSKWDHYAKHWKRIE